MSLIHLNLYLKGGSGYPCISSWKLIIFDYYFFLKVTLNEHVSKKKHNEIITQIKVYIKPFSVGHATQQIYRFTWNNVYSHFKKYQNYFLKIPLVLTVSMSHWMTGLMEVEVQRGNLDQKQCRIYYTSAPIYMYISCYVTYNKQS